MIVEKCISLKNYLDNQIINKLITYCNSVRYCLSDNIKRKYDFLFNNISDICANFMHKLDGSMHLAYLSNNLDSIIDFKTDSIVRLEKFIINKINKNSYRDSISEDQNDSDNDSDVDIYLDKNFIFTKDDLESDSDNINTHGYIDV